MSSSRFILLAVRRGEKSTQFIFSYCSRHFQVIPGLVLQQPHTAVTLINSWDIWGTWGADSEGLAEDIHVVNSGAWLAFQDWSFCGVFGDRIKLIWGPSWQSRASGIQTGKLEAWEVRGPYKWVLTLGSLWESNKTDGLPPPKYLNSPCPHPPNTHSHKDKHIPKSESPGSNFIDPCKQDCVSGFCLPGQMQNPQYLTENAVHSCH